MAEVSQRATSVFSMVLMLITLFSVSFLLYRTTYKFSTLDKMPHLLPLTPKNIEEFGGISGVARVGLYIRSFSNFDILANDFTFTGIVWFEFDPSIVSLDTLGKFTFDRGEIQYVSTPNTRLVGGKLIARYDIRVKLKTGLNYALFPFESHILHIVLDNNTISPAEVLFESSNADFTLSPDILVVGTKVVDKHVYTGYSVASLEENDSVEEDKTYHPRVIFAIDYAQPGMRKTITIFLPLLFIFFMSVFSLTIDPEKYYTTILSLSSGSITGLLAYRFVIENLSPKVNYFMLSDFIFFLFLFIGFLLFFISTGAIKLTMTQKLVVAAATHALVIAGFAYVLSF